MKNGWKLHEIDSMDMHFFLYLMQGDEEQEETVFIDQIF